MKVIRLFAYFIIILSLAAIGLGVYIYPNYMNDEVDYEDTDDFIIIQQEAGLNVVLTILYLLITFGCEIGVAKFRYDVSDFSFSSKVKAIKRKYPKIDRKLLEKKLNIKRQTYNRLVGGKNE